MVEGMSIEEIPAATWAAFSYEYPAGFSLYEENYKRIVTEWLPASGYKRDENVIHLELYADEKWQLWIPIISKTIRKTDRLILRRFQENDLKALDLLIRDKISSKYAPYDAQGKPITFLASAYERMY